jgi:DnaJ-class molecular chaperone
MSKRIGKRNKCTDCNGTGYIITTLKKYVNCIICNGSGTTSQEHMQSEAEQVFLYKLTWDYINGKKNGWYH